jgi:hypothetical protein
MHAMSLSEEKDASVVVRPSGTRVRTIVCESLT